MSKFEEGDIIEAIETHKGNYITKGRFYTVDNINGEGDIVYFTGDGEEPTGVFCSRFKLASEKSDIIEYPVVNKSVSYEIELKSKSFTLTKKEAEKLYEKLGELL